MNHEITIGGLRLYFEPMKYSFPGGRSLRDPIAISAKMTTPFSETTAELLCIPYSDLVTFRNKLRSFLHKQEDAVVSLGVLMPSFDIALVSESADLVVAHIRLSPDLRLERHMYDFELTWNEVSRIRRDLDILLVSLPLHHNA